MRRASTRSSRTRPPSGARCSSARRSGRLTAAARGPVSSPPPSCGTAPFGAACAPRRSAWCATARRCRPPRRAAGPGSATARSTTSSSPTACWNCTPPARRWSSKACSSASPISGGPPTTWRSISVTPCRSTPTSRPLRRKASSCTSTTTTCSCCNSTAPSAGGCGSRWSAPGTPCVRGHVSRCRRSTSSVSPAMDLTLQAGDCLYLPRGFPHAAETIDAASSHLTIGIIAPTWAQAVRHAVDEAVADGDLRESIAVDVSGRPGLEALVPHLDPLALRRWMAQEVWRRQPATRLRPLYPPTIGLDTRIVVTPGPLLWLTPAGDRVELGLGDRALTMPAEAADLLDADPAQPPTVHARRAGREPRRRVPARRRCAPRGRRGGHTWLSEWSRFMCAEAARERAGAGRGDGVAGRRPGCSSRSTARGGATPSSTASWVRTPR